MYYIHTYNFTQQYIHRVGTWPQKHRQQKEHDNSFGIHISILLVWVWNVLVWVCTILPSRYVLKMKIHSNETLHTPIHESSSDAIQFSIVVCDSELLVSMNAKDSTREEEKMWRKKNEHLQFYVVKWIGAQRTMNTNSVGVMVNRQSTFIYYCQFVLVWNWRIFTALKQQSSAFPLCMCVSVCVRMCVRVYVAQNVGICLSSFKCITLLRVCITFNRIVYFSLSHTRENDSNVDFVLTYIVWMEIVAQYQPNVWICLTKLVLCVVVMAHYMVCFRLPKNLYAFLCYPFLYIYQQNTFLTLYACATYIPSK